MASPVRIGRTARAATITVVLAAFAVLPGCLQDSGEPGLFTGPSELLGTPVTPPPPPPASQPTGSLEAIIVFSPKTPAADQTVFFDGSDSTSPSGITVYAWNFGDGTTASGVAVSHTFSAAGTYVVRLTVTATDGSTATTTQNVVVSAAAPPGTLTAVITFSPQAPSAGQTVFFDGSGSTSPSGIASYAWDFGDGTTTTASGVTIPHTFSAAGAYVVRLTVTATDTSTATTTQNLVVTATAPAPSADPVANFSFSPLAPAVDDRVSFNASSSSAAAGRTIASYAWTFGDNTSVTSVTPTTTHTYTPSGVYTVVLTVTDDVGNTSTTAKSVNVGSPPQPTAAFQTSIGAAGTLTFFDARTSTTQAGQTIVLYEWNFGDSTTIFSCDLVTGDGIGPDASDAECGASGGTMRHTYAAAADYSITLVVTDSAGRTDAQSATITVP